MEERINYKAAYDAAKAEPDELEIFEKSEQEKVVSVLGRVVDCTHLNIREKPSKDAPIAATVPKDTILTIDQDESTSTWYKVYTVAGVNGFCMKDFVSTK